MTPLHKLLFGVVAAIGFSALVGCSVPNNNQTGTIGNVGINGDSVASVSSVGGLPVTFNASNITLINGSSVAQAQYGYYYVSAGGYFPGVQFNLSVNGVAKTMVALPTITNLNYNYGSSQSQMYRDVIGNFQVYYESRCGNVACDQAFLHIMLTNGPETKQVGIRKDMQLNKIIAAIETQGPTGSALTTDQIISQLVAKSGPGL